MMKVMMQKLNRVKYAYTETEQKDLERKGFQVVIAEKRESELPMKQTEDPEGPTDNPSAEQSTEKQSVESEKKPASGGRRGSKRDDGNG